MRYLLDTGILLRLLNRQALNHDSIRRAARSVKARGHECCTSFQNICEFWNVCTRPSTSRGGLGITVEETSRRLKTIERICTILPDSPATLARWKELVSKYQVQGVQVHDTRMIALMDVHGVTNLLTLNPGDFNRFSHIVTETPDAIG